jgi:hypothetical protein
MKNDNVAAFVAIFCDDFTHGLAISMFLIFYGALVVIDEC